MSTQNSSDKAHQLREKQAAELENANKMEQQCLKQIANKKEHNRVRKEEEAERKYREEEQRGESENTAVVMPAVPPEEATMHIDQPNPGITTLLSDMMQGNTETKEGENINPETRSPPKNKQKNNATALKPSTTTAAVSEKSVHTKNDKHVYKFSRIVVEASIKLLNDNPFQEFIVALQNLLKNGHLVDPLFAFTPIKIGGSEKKIQEWSGIPINMTLLGTHFKISSDGLNSFEKQKVWGKGNNKNKEEFHDPMVYFTIAIATYTDPDELILHVVHEWGRMGRVHLQIKELQHHKPKYG
jgi:hypothetical protein